MFLLGILLLLATGFSFSIHLPFIKDEKGYMVRLNDSIVHISREGELSVIKNGKQIFYELPVFMEKPEIQEGKKIKVRVIKGDIAKEYESTDLIMFAGKKVDLLYTVRGGGVEKTLIVKPGTGIEQILFIVKGADIERDGEGRLILRKGGNIFRFSKPVAYQYINNKKRFVEISYKIYKGGYGFKVGDYDKSKVLVIDPIITSLTDGGSQVDIAYAVAKVGSYIYVAGSTLSNDFDTLSGNYKGGKDIFIIKFSADLKNIISAIYYGGFGDEEVFDIKADSSGNIYLVGYSNSSDICTGVSSEQILILKFSSSLSLLAERCVGNSNNSRALNLLIDGTYLYVTGFTEGQIESYTGFQGVKDAFLIKLDKNLNINDILYIGGSGMDEGTYLSSDASYIYVVGTTQSADLFGVNSNSLQSSSGGSEDCFISKINKSTFAITKSTYLGGSGEDSCVSVKYISAWGDILILMNTFSQDLSLVNGSNPYGMQDIYIARINTDLSLIKRSSYLGGSNTDTSTDMILDSSTNIYITGITYSADLYTTGSGVQESIKGGGDAFVMKLDDKFSPVISTYLGGNSEDKGYGIYVDGNYLYIVGFTKSTDFPIKYPKVIVKHGNDLFITYMTISLPSGGGVLPGGGGGGGDGSGGTAPVRESESGKGCNTGTSLSILLFIFILTKLMRKRV